MKKTLVIGLAIGLVSLVASAAFAGPSALRPIPKPGNQATWNQSNHFEQKNVGGAGIVGSSHDMSGVGRDDLNPNQGASKTATLTDQAPDVQKRICVYCHHPHNAYSAGTAKGGQSGQLAAIGSYSPLWNRTASANQQTFTGYSNGIMMAGTTASSSQHALNANNVGGGTSITGVSLLCMSCHDGVTAMSAYSKVTGSSVGAGDEANGLAISGTAAFKSNMNNHHPMGFNYKAVQAADSEIAGVGVVMVPQPSDINGVNNTPTNTSASVKIGDLLYGSGTMECVTCHDVHNTLNEQGAERFLWRSNNESNFCLTCHLK